MIEKTYASPDVQEALGERSFIAALLRFEAALARAQATAGLIAEGVAQSIIGTCKVDLFDVGQILRDGGRGGNVAAPLVTSLRETVALFNPEAAASVHRGCSYRDAMETAKALVTRTVIGRVESDLVSATQALLTLAERHATTPQLQRTLLHAGPPSSFGLRCAAWATPLVHSLQRLRRTASRALCVQLGSAFDAETAASGVSDTLVHLVAEELSLGVNAAPGWSCSDGWVALGCELGILAGHLGRTAHELALLGQPEIAEVLEAERPAASPASNRVPRPPAVSACIAAAQTAPPRVAVLLAALAQQDGSPLETRQLDTAEWSWLLMAVQGSARALAQVLTGLHVDAARMRRNVEAWHAQRPAEAGGWASAEASVQQVNRQITVLRAVLAQSRTEAA